MPLASYNSFVGLIDNIYQTHSVLQQNAQKAVNRNLVIRNWLIGCYIVEFEQNGEDRAKYGEHLIDEISKALRSRGLKGFAPTPLRIYRKFYSTYPQIQPTLSVELQHIDFKAIEINFRNVEKFNRQCRLNPIRI